MLSIAKPGEHGLLNQCPTHINPEVAAAATWEQGSLGSLARHLSLTAWAAGLGQSAQVTPPRLGGLMAEAACTALSCASTLLAPVIAPFWTLAKPLCCALLYLSAATQPTLRAPHTLHGLTLPVCEKRRVCYAQEYDSCCSWA